MRHRRSKRLINPEATCYMCDKPAITREHAPPLAFFPSDLRNKLITVPSCKFHNNDNSKDVEYVRNIIATDINSNDVARRVFSEKVLPSFRHSPKLRNQTFARVREVEVWGMPSGIVQTNRSRFKPVMKSIASALYFNEFGEKFAYKWDVHSTHMLSENQAFLDLPDPLTPRMNALLRSVPVADRDTNQPEVFKYGVYQGREAYSVVYRLVFYGAVETFVFALPPGDDNE